MNSVTATSEWTTGRTGPALEKNHGRPRLREAAVRQPVQTGWRVLYGGFDEPGVSVEWHDFRLATPFDWSRRFHAGSLGLCLNLAGHGSIRAEENVMDLQASTAGFYVTGENDLQAMRHSGEQHRFLTLQFSAGFLREKLSPCDGGLHPLVQAFMEGGPGRAGLSQIHRLTSDQERLVAHLVRSPVFQAARSLWYQSKVLQLMVEFFFQQRDEDELFCDRQKRVARERVDRVIGVLRQDLAEPPGLEELGRRAGCSPFHLSRTFSQEMGMTIPQYLRKIRMERAAELLRSGKCNVTETALEVGYSSLSHFSQAFCQTMGCCPGLYPPASLRS